MKNLKTSILCKVSVQVQHRAFSFFFAFPPLYIFVHKYLLRKKYLSTYMEQQNRTESLPQELTCTPQRLELLKIYAPEI